MIQRVQSIYLLLITVLMSFMLFRPYAEVVYPDNQMLIFKAHAITLYSVTDIVSTYKSTIPVILLVFVIALLSFSTIFLYNHRIMQIRLALLTFVLLVILVGIMLVYYMTIKLTEADAQATIRLAMVFPVLAMIFCMMAIRSIRHDEMLVNSYNRIR